MNAMIRKTKGKKVAVEFREISKPTDERMKKLDRSDYQVGDDKQGRCVITVRDAPIDRLLVRRVIDGSEHAALMKYFHHWHHGGLESGVSTMDLNRVFSSDPGSMSGMAKSERQAFHRKLYRQARELIGHQTGIVVDNVLCAGHSLEVAGYSIGYSSPYRAREGATKHIRRAADILGRHWGIR